MLWDMHGVLLWADMNAATPPGARGALCSFRRGGSGYFRLYQLNRYSTKVTETGTAFPALQVVG